MEYYVEENITLYSHILMVDEVTSLISQSNAVFRLAYNIFNVFITNCVTISSADTLYHIKV